jgi:hypothetical protein
MHDWPEQDLWFLLKGYMRSIYTLAEANLITFDEFMELRDLYWAMQYQPEPALIEPRTAA